MVRLHNLFEQRIDFMNPGMSSELLFQHARRFTVACWQSIVFNEFANVILGNTAHDFHQLKPSQGGYDPNLDPTLDNAFSAAAFRLGHTYIPNDFPYSRNDFSETVEVELQDVNMKYRTLVYIYRTSSCKPAPWVQKS